MNNLKLFIKGIIIGSAGIAPGISGGALAISMNIYDKIMDTISNFFKNPKKYLPFALTLGLGGLLGILVFSNIIAFLFENYNTIVRLAFVGLILGTIPDIFQTAKKEGFKYSYLLISLISMLLILLLSQISGQRTLGHPGPILEFISGLIVGFGTIVPGVSASALLMSLGTYDKALSAIANLDIGALVFLGLGFLISFFGLAKLVNYFFKKYYSQAYFAVLGFLIGSIFPIFPEFSLTGDIFIGVAAMIVCGLISYKLTKKQV